MLNEQNNKHYTPPPSPHQKSVWIDTLKGIYKFLFFTIIAIGLIICIKSSANDEVWGGLLIFVASAIIAVVTVGFIIVFLELADDIRNIVNYLYQIGNIMEDDKNNDISGNIHQIKTILENSTAKKE